VKLGKLKLSLFSIFSKKEGFQILEYKKSPSSNSTRPLETHAVVLTKLFIRVKIRNLEAKMPSHYAKLCLRENFIKALKGVFKKFIVAGKI
jgi:hypothetical protein